MAKGEDGTIILARRVLTPFAEIAEGAVHVSSGRVEWVGPQDRLSASADERHFGECLIPGMIDLHINGAGGADAAQGTPDALDSIGRTLARHGATGYLPTLITDRRQPLLQTLESVAESLEKACQGARPLGIHLEGPFLNPARKGAHDPSCMQPPTAQAFEDFFQASGGYLRMLTLAPEMPGALDLIPAARRRLPLLALGHSEADLECAREAIRRGANLAVHIFNAMKPLHHREPGLVAAVLNSDDCAAEVIADGVHVHPEAVKLVYRCKGAARVALVTDAVSAAGMPDGRYRVGNIEIELQDGVCRDGHGSLAGSALQMDAGLRNLKSWLADDPRFALGEIVGSATALPADLLGLSRKGRIEIGCDADLTLLNAEFQVLKTWVSGELVYDSQAR